MAARKPATVAGVTEQKGYELYRKAQSVHADAVKALEVATAELALAKVRRAAARVSVDDVAASSMRSALNEAEAAAEQARAA